MCKLLFSGGAFVAVYEAKDSLTHFDEVRARFDGAGISCLEELPIEVQVVGVGDATGPWRHDNQPRSQEEGFLYTVGDGKEHLVGLLPDIEQQFLNGFAGEIGRAHV